MQEIKSKASFEGLYIHVPCQAMFTGTGMHRYAQVLRDSAALSNVTGVSARPQTYPGCILGALGAVHTHSHRCHIWSSGSVYAAAASYKTTTELPAWGCTQHLHIPLLVKHGPVLGTDVIAPSDQVLRVVTRQHLNGG